MSNIRKNWWILLVAMVAIVVIWRYAAGTAGPVAANGRVRIIAPYWNKGTWVFDDPAVGLRHEPFVAGVPELIDVLVKDIPDAKKGFRLFFSTRPFPGYQKKLTWLRSGSGGNYYQLDTPLLEGWLCPALFKYYQAPPKAIYVKAEPRQG